MSETVNASQAARIVGVNEKTVRRWIKDGKLPARKVGREQLVRIVDAKALVTGNGVRYRHVFWRLYWRSA